jgi:cardiolipin synthase (CMP-forming)
LEQTGRSDSPGQPPPPQPILTLPNQLTLLRMGLAPVLVVLVLRHELVWAVAVFVVAGITDLLDGLIARLGHQQTRLGAMLDPVADKLLLSATFIVLTWGPALVLPIPVWLTVIVLSRDAIILISVAVVNLTVGPRVFLPSWLGKASTALQLLTVAVVLLLNALDNPAPAISVLFQLTLVVTVASALHYVWRASAHPPDTAP